MRFRNMSSVAVVAAAVVAVATASVVSAITVVAVVVVAAAVVVIQLVQSSQIVKFQLGGPISFFALLTQLLRVARKYTKNQLNGRESEYNVKVGGMKNENRYYN